MNSYPKLWSSLDLPTDVLQSIAAGASGGVPLTILLISSLRNLRESFDKVKDQVEGLSTRLIKLETFFDLTYKGEVQALKARIEKLETYILERE